MDMIILIGNIVLVVNSNVAAWTMRRHLRFAQWLLFGQQIVWLIYGPLTHQYLLAVNACFFGLGMLNTLTGCVDRFRERLKQLWA